MPVIDTDRWPARDNPSGHRGPGLPGSFQAHWLRELRSQVGWYQAKLAEKINFDTRQVLRHKGGKVAPGLEPSCASPKHSVSPSNDLFTPDAPRRPLHAARTPWLTPFDAVATLDPEAQAHSSGSSTPS